MDRGPRHREVAGVGKEEEEIKFGGVGGMVAAIRAVYQATLN
jgi:hypothetical protein